MSPVFYPYIASDYFHKNNNLKMEDFYASFFFLFSGFPIGTYIAKFLLNVFGIIDSFIVLGFFYLLNAYILYSYTNLSELFFLYILVGVEYQICSTSINLLLTQKYENGLRYYKYVTTSRLGFAFLIVSVALNIINKNNRPANI